MMLSSEDASLCLYEDTNFIGDPPDFLARPSDMLTSHMSQSSVGEEEVKDDSCPIRANSEGPDLSASLLVWHDTRSITRLHSVAFKVGSESDRVIITRSAPDLFQMKQIDLRSRSLLLFIIVENQDQNFKSDLKSRSKILWYSRWKLEKLVPPTLVSPRLISR